MAVSMMHVLEQGPVLAALGRTAVTALRRPALTAGAPAVPGSWIEATLPPRSEALIRDYVRHVGGDPGWYRGIVPAHLFPQWTFPLITRALRGLPYPLLKVVNAGASIEQRAPLPAGEPLQVRVRLESIDDDGRRVILTSRTITGTASAPDAIIADLRAYVPLPRSPDAGASKPAAKSRPLVPADARELAFLRIGPSAGLDFAKLTGDFNPIHWLPAYARASGFRTTILHGFASLARALEAINRRILSGDVRALSTIDARFTAPLLLPARVGVYTTTSPSGARRAFLGDSPSGAAYLDAPFTLHRGRFSIAE